MNTQRPLPNPFGPDKKVPFPARMPSTGITPPPAAPVAAPLLPPILTPLPPVPPLTPHVSTPEESIESYLEDLTLETEDEELAGEEVTDEEDDFLSRIFAATTLPVAQQTLFALARDANWQIRNSVAMSLEAPKTVLNLLFNDEEDFVRQTVMENLNTADETYAGFAYDESEDIQIAFISNKRTTLELLIPLLDTDNEFVADALLESPLLTATMKLKIHTKFAE